MIHDIGHVAAAIDRFRATRWYKEAEAADQSVAVCLIGYTTPIVAIDGSNALTYPKRVKASKHPQLAAKELDNAHAVHSVATLTHVWTPCARDADELKRALDVRILGNDPEMIKLRNSWRDMPEWETAWDILLADAVSEIRQRRPLEVYSDDERVMRIIAKARERMRKSMDGRR